jgi:hypothetical protein
VFEVVTKHLLQGRRVAGVLIGGDLVRHGSGDRHGGAEERFGGFLIVGLAQVDVDQVAVAVDRPVQILPLTGNLDVGLILSANSGNRCQGGEGCDAGLGAGPAVKPVHDPRHIHRGGDANLLKPGLCQPDIATAAHAEGTDAL